MYRKLLMLGFAAATVQFLTACGVFGNSETAAQTPAKPAEVKAAVPAAQPAPAKYKAPKLENAASWTMVVVPDVQGYSKLRRNYGIMEIMNAWIV